jgi:undecaprenyl-diphosphatase
LSTFPGDIEAAVAIQDLRGTWLGDVMRGSRWIGDPERLLVLLVPALLLLTVRRRPLHALAWSIAAAGAVVFVPLAQAVIDRPAPEHYLIGNIAAGEGRGFPSGHAIAAVVVLGGLFNLAPVLFGNNRAVIIGSRAALAAVILLAGVARVYDHAHWPSEVIGGYLFATLGLLVAFRLATLVTLMRMGTAQRSGSDVESTQRWW